MIHRIQPLVGLDLKGKHKDDNWKSYHQRWDNYCIVSHTDTQREEYRVALLLHCIGQDAMVT